MYNSSRSEEISIPTISTTYTKVQYCTVKLYKYYNLYFLFYVHQSFVVVTSRALLHRRSQLIFPTWEKWRHKPTYTTTIHFKIIGTIFIWERPLWKWCTLLLQICGKSKTLIACFSMQWYTIQHEYLLWAISHQFTLVTTHQFFAIKSGCDPGFGCDNTFWRSVFDPKIETTCAGSPSFSSSFTRGTTPFLVWGGLTEHNTLAPSLGFPKSETTWGVFNGICSCLDCW